MPNYKPVGNKVLVKEIVEQVESKSEAGLYIPESSVPVNGNIVKCTVEAVGDDADYVRNGDTVYVNLHSCLRMFATKEDERGLLLTEDNAILVVEG